MMKTSTTPLSISATSPQSNSCCQNFDEPSPWQKRTDIICKIAIGIFAAALAPIPMTVAFLAGAIGGAVYAAVKLIQQQPMFPDGQSKPVCAQGYMDFLSGMRFPPIIGTAATTAFIAAHMRHDPSFYVPFCGFFIGFWMGREAVIAAKSAVEPALPKPSECCCD